MAGGDHQRRPACDHGRSTGRSGAIDIDAVRAACARQAARATAGIADMRGYLSRQVTDTTHREVLGPLLPGSGTSGVVVHQGHLVGAWGEPDTPEMLFSATKSVVSLVAGLAYDRGLFDVDAQVADTVELAALNNPAGRQVRWRHLLQQTSGWNGQLWGKPAASDAQSHRDGPEPRDQPAGSHWAYNDVRVNLLCLALTAVLAEPLPAVLRREVMKPLGASNSWSWHGYRNSSLRVGAHQVPVVSGGAHWGGGLWMSANDLALIGELYLRGGEWRGRRLLSASWVADSWRPCPVRADYGYLWWLNDRQTVFAHAPGTGRCARGNRGRHLLWVDPARELVVAAHWAERIEELLATISAAIPA